MRSVRGFTTERGARSPAPDRFVLYVEGARDRGLIEVWARVHSWSLAAWVARETVILGGRRPRRAHQHYLGLREREPRLRALCLLDGDAGEANSTSLPEPEPGLEIVTWPRRHVESYLLVPGAIRRGLRLPAHDRRVERFFARYLPPPEDEAALRRYNAKALFTAHSALSKWLGGPVSPLRVARAMRDGEIHRDVRELLERLGVASRRPTPVWIVRR